MTGWEKTDERNGLSVQKGTPHVPSDGRYHLLVDGKIVLSTKVESLALLEFEERRAARRQTLMEGLRQEKSAMDVQRHRASTWKAKSARDGKKGGRGVGR